MSLSKTLGSRNIWVLFFSALSISLLVLLLLFSFFFKNLDLGIQTKELSEAPTLRTGVNMQNTALNEEETLDAESLQDRVRVNVPSEAERLKRIAKESKTTTTTPKKQEAYVGIDASQASNPKTQEDLAPVPEASSEATPQKALTAPQASVVKKFRVYLGGFFTKGDAEATQARLKAQGYNSIIKQSNSGFEVQLGVFTDEPTAKAMASSTGASLESL
jgi:cell division protein FtsN